MPFRNTFGLRVKGIRQLDLRTRHTSILHLHQFDVDVTFETNFSLPRAPPDSDLWDIFPRGAGFGTRDRVTHVSHVFHRIPTSFLTVFHRLGRGNVSAETSLAHVCARFVEARCSCRALKKSNPDADIGARVVERVGRRLHFDHDFAEMTACLHMA